ncbi:MAG: Rho termination factor N-terminal domain-containing protein [Promethearchaeota archaeon]
MTEISHDEIERVFTGSFTKKELTEIAKEHDLKGLSKLKKKELIALLFENVALDILYSYAEERIKKHRELEAEVKDLSFEELLGRLTDEKRLKNGLAISDSDVKLIEETDDSWHLKIKNYDCQIDMNRRIIRHDCTDWGFRGKREHILCKHVVKAISKIKYAKKLVKSLVLDKWAYL